MNQDSVCLMFIKRIYNRVLKKHVNINIRKV